MIKKYLLPLFAAFILFLGLVFYNYLQAQKAIQETRPAPLGISFVSYPQDIFAGSRGSFIWNIVASPDLKTTFTTIYWGYESSPSALTLLDSPQAVGYPNFQTDYSTGIFSLPGSFDQNITFDKPGRVFFRAYAKVKDNHLWSEEENLLVK
ncbi:MAG: hypothetical protein UW68_C0010G0005 [Candidatus Collierbacteria bacterium GW2011_GWB1_44_6]|uniref:Uncharacterized protein n=2 Tax=Candidatus Collieribacteriota TaxID=1752725 RepID=A0A0G1MN01_9BACT|nr:MAG: hypothetical protein UV68_C0005G0027 [Candidatus Collierbacteria bacterium GW2011_GWC2_43_12]KKT73394.1 MAG: hypothetical protein UW68_C0010G0005 [Candidatus Collierbacteria bacterium GW2011_GWB1_44_6]KKT82912.1 MAG: hypothetical protein UW80_C0027G0018 [Microgenomates group bacterium GW2011_GWC1_44_9]